MSKAKIAAIAASVTVLTAAVVAATALTTHTGSRRR
jgi:hypothetical protein